MKSPVVVVFVTVSVPVVVKHHPFQHRCWSLPPILPSCDKKKIEEQELEGEDEEKKGEDGVNTNDQETHIYGVVDKAVITTIAAITAIAAISKLTIDGVVAAMKLAWWTICGVVKASKLTTNESP